MTAGRLEILVEPFREGDPGPHVLAVLDILRSHGFKIEMGPFSSTAEGDLNKLMAIVQELVSAGFEAGATGIQTRLERV